MDKVMVGLGGVLGAATLVIAVATAFMVAQMGRTDAAIADIGKIQGDIKVVKEDIESIRKDMADNTDLLGKLAEGQGEIKASLLEIRTRTFEAETDPEKLMARMGIEMSEGFSAAYIKGKVYVFPRNEQGVMLLKDAGYVPTQITPVLAGFSLQK